jgi:HAD superfamily hydrolase (TIGR01549 family)
LKRPFDVILFDLGSTLIYFNADFAQVLAAGYADCYSTLDANGIKLEREAFLARFQAQMEAYRREREMEFIEYTTQYILRLTLAEFGYPEVDETLLRQAVDAIYGVTQQYWETEHDTQATLQELQKDGYRLGLISNAGDGPDVQALVDQVGLRPYFDVILVSADLGIRKPNPRIFQHALEHWGIVPQRAAMVGDTLGADILGAHNAGLFSIWITRRADSPGNHEYAETIQPDARVATLQELPALLRSMKQ